jgi:peroxiredoxin
MAIEVGGRMPRATVRRVGAGGAIEEVSTEAFFAGRRVALFGVPGAFTPTCSNQHLPGFVARAEELAGAGIDAVACLAVNDAWVMDAWREAQGVGDRIAMLADGAAELTRALGLENDLSAIGLGIRCRRFAAVVDDGVFTHLAVEPARGVTVCGAEHLLAALTPA